MIFAFSGQSAEKSSALSGSITETVLSWLPSYQKLLPAEKTDVLSVAHKFIRSAAHVITFAALGFCSRMLVECYTLRGAFVLTWGFGVAVAFFDECLQRFLDAGRTFQWVDLLKDWCGNLLGAGLATVVLLALHRRNKQREEQ